MATEYTDRDVLLMRQGRVLRLTELIANEYGADEVVLAGEALWLAMQIICGPERAAHIVSHSLR